MSRPRIFRISASLFSSRFSPLNRIVPLSMRPFCAMSRMIESEVTDLPEPDSPTMPSVEPGSTLNDNPLTAATTPSSVLNVVLQVVDLEQSHGLRALRHRGAKSPKG